MLPPHPSALMESLRAFGYDMSTALADLVDNSIAAGAREVRIEFSSDPGGAWVAVVDDGCGMTESRLHEAVRFGGLGPDRPRDKSDLGRFGLGLKTASLSQCRHLTVMSRTLGGTTSVRSWDMDLVRDTGDWCVLTAADEQAVRIAEEVGFTGIGTMVLWRHLDRAGDGPLLARRLARTRARLEMWFHRFLESGRLRLSHGRRESVAWDPFMRDLMATQDTGPELLRGAGEAVRVTPYVLPHPARLTESELATGAGPRGWNAQQGFYVYRGDRMVSAGGWLGLRDLTQTPTTRLARIAVDISPSADARWQVDVRKSRVHPPAELENRLFALAEHTREASRRVFRRRQPGSSGAPGAAEVAVVWQQVRRPDGRVCYTVNRRHPLTAAALQSSDAGALEAILRLVEASLPIGYIALEAQADMTRVPQASLEGATEDQARADLEAMLGALPAEPAMRRAVLRVLATSEPFNRFPRLLEQIAAHDPADGA
ncbi:ATP-binding protein [Embleya scabrispora]|uniref:ATP-binding protein n=1 Tax=Embleya scabrispora TaxID=159449 RepID=UPI000363B606|nr:ATP-binding protein [Embleya scabrispora]MYS81056.1 ATP-binding protein [Streptomyces sp. SID5474]